MADATTIEFVLAAWLETLPEALELDAKAYPWGKAPQTTATRPAILYQKIAGGRMRSLGGPSGVSYPMIQIDVVGRNYVQVRRLSAAIREALEALEPNAEVGGRTIQAAIVDDERDVEDTDPDVKPQFSNEIVEHRAMIQVRIWFTESN